MRKPPLIATLCAIAGIAVLCGLGFWQLERLEWKEGLLADIAAARQADPLQSSLSFESFTLENAYRRGLVNGAYDHAHEILLGPRLHGGKGGYHLYTPLYLKENRAVLVNRGWIAEHLKDPAARPETLIRGQTQVTGTIAPPPQANLFTPENDPESAMSYRIDLPGLERALGVTLAPMIFWAEESPYRGADLVRIPGQLDIRNDHLQYAIFWFAMAGILAITFYARFLRRG